MSIYIVHIEFGPATGNMVSVQDFLYERPVDAMDVALVFDTSASSALLSGC
jgi:hypothetical protein